MATQSIVVEVASNGRMVLPASGRKVAGLNIAGVTGDHGLGVACCRRYSARWLLLEGELRPQ